MIRLGDDAVFDVPDDVCREIYETNPVLRHYDRASGQYVDLNPFGENKAQR